VISKKALHRKLISKFGIWKIIPYCGYLTISLGQLHKLMMFTGQVEILPRHVLIMSLASLANSSQSQAGIPVDDVDHRVVPSTSTSFLTTQQQKFYPKLQTMDKMPTQSSSDSLRAMTPSPPVLRKKKKEGYCPNQALASLSGIPSSFFYNYATESVLDQLFSKRRELICGNARPPTESICSGAENCNWDVSRYLT